MKSILIIFITFFVSMSSVTLFAAGAGDMADSAIDDASKKEFTIITGRKAADLFLKMARSAKKDGEYDKVASYLNEAINNMFMENLVEDDLQTLYDIVNENRMIELKSKKTYTFTEKKLYNQFSSIYFNLALVYSSQHYYDDAIYNLQKSAFYNSKNIDAYNNLGICYDLTEKYEQAIESYKKALSINPNNNIVYYNMACSYSLQKKTDISLDYLEKAIKYGYKNKSGILKDATLNNINKTEKFKKILDLIK